MAGARRLRELIRTDAPVLVSGAHDLLATKLVAQHGVSAVLRPAAKELEQLVGAESGSQLGQRYTLV